MYYKFLLLFIINVAFCLDPELPTALSDIEPLTSATYQDLLTERGNDLILARVITRGTSKYYESTVEAENFAHYIVQLAVKQLGKNPFEYEFRQWSAGEQCTSFNRLPIHSIITYPQVESGCRGKSYAPWVSKNNLLLYILEHPPRYDLTHEQQGALGIFFSTLHTRESLTVAQSYFKQVADSPQATDTERVQVYKWLAHNAWLLKDVDAQKKYFELYVDRVEEKTSFDARVSCLYLAWLYSASDEPIDRARACAYATRIIQCSDSSLVQKNAMRMVIAKLSGSGCALRYAREVLQSKEPTYSAHKNEARALIKRLEG